MSRIEAGRAWEPGSTLPVLWRPPSSGSGRELAVSAVRRVPPPALHDPRPLPVPGRGQARLRAAYGLDERPEPLIDVLA
jgi:hypothetical protein